MKKSMIAVGAASVALAAMPVVGVFASHTDTVQVEIETACTVSLKTGGHAAGAVGAVATTWNSNTLSGSMKNGTYSENYGSTTLSVTCNDDAGFNVSATPTALTAGTVEDGSGHKLTIPVGSNIDGEHSAWSFKVTSVDASLGNNATAWQTGTSSSIVDANDPVSGGEFTVTYGASIDSTQPADTYTGTITYGVTGKTV